ncbi:MAG: hypothetical protein HQK75_14890 [Candidatus Magnetomorum sp.]|nr:hypothetical protein [Candidatus Magnetomorum sp.]
MSDKDKIKTSVDLLTQRDTSLFMACQLIDLYAFLSMGGIATKAVLNTANVPFSKYDTDTIQKANGFWDAHVLHLADYGAQFYRNAQKLPNPNGPVLFHIKPDILRTAEFVNMTHTSVRSERFEQAHLQPITDKDLNDCYQNAAETSFPEKTLLKKALLENSGTGQMVPEIICRFDQGLIPFSYVSLVSVDHYIINNCQFQSLADEMKVRAGHTFPLMRRYCPSSIAIHLSVEIGRMLINGPLTINDIIHSEDDRLQAWGLDLKHRQLTEMFDIYKNHLQLDTLLPLYHGEISAEKIDQLSEWVRQKNQAVDQLSETDALALLKELAMTDPKIAKRIQSLQNVK